MRVKDVAALFGVEQKTVHNWVALGMIPHFRTPGRHVRFTPAEVADFVTKYRRGDRDRGRGSGRGRGLTGETSELGEPLAAKRGGGTSSVVVVVVHAPKARTGRGLEGELQSLRRELPESRMVWLGDARRGIPVELERAASVKDLRRLLDGKQKLHARNGHRRHSDRG